MRSDTAFFSAADIFRRFLSGATSDLLSVAAGDFALAVGNGLCNDTHGYSWCVLSWALLVEVAPLTPQRQQEHSDSEEEGIPVRRVNVSQLHVEEVEDEQEHDETGWVSEPALTLLACSAACTTPSASPLVLCHGSRLAVHWNRPR